MIREATPDDASAVTVLAIAAGLFAPEDAEIIDTLLDDYFGGARARGHRCVIDDEAGGLVGAAYYEPAPATDGTWYLTMIAVHPARQGRGRGMALLGHVQGALREDGQRLLLVQTSGMPGFDRSRHFYAKCGYAEEARVRDYYASGDDMVLFRMVLGAS